MSNPNKTQLSANDALSSWNDNEKKIAILNYINTIIDENSEKFIPIKDRIAVFDNDGTLWPEQPYPNQAAFALEYFKKNVDNHPEWLESDVISALISDDLLPMLSRGMEGVLEAVFASHTGLTVEEFDENVTNWINTAKDKKFKKLFTNQS